MSNDASTTPRGAAQLRRDISSTRRELAETLDALEYKLDVPARASEWIDDRVDQVKRAWDENPGLVIGIAAGAATIVIGVIAGAFTLPCRGR